MSDIVENVVAPAEITPSADSTVKTAPTPADKAARMLELENSVWSERAAGESAPVAEVAAAAPVEVKEEVVTPTETAPAPEDEFTKRFAQLSKMESQFRQREQQFKEREKELEEAKQFRELKSKVKTSPKEVAEALGLTINDLAMAELNEGEFKDKRKVDEVAERLQKIEDMTKKAEEQAAIQQQQEAARKYVEKIHTQIDAAGDKYSLVKNLSGAKQLVINTISEYYQRSGEELPWDKAAQMTEDYLLDQKIKEINYLMGVEKVRSKLNIPKPEAKVEPKTTKTITNSIASAPATKEVNGKLTKEERYRRKLELEGGVYE